MVSGPLHAPVQPYPGTVEPEYRTERPYERGSAGVPQGVDRESPAVVSNDSPHSHAISDSSAASATIPSSVSWTTSLSFVDGWSRLRCWHVSSHVTSWRPCSNSKARSAVSDSESGRLVSEGSSVAIETPSRSPGRDNSALRALPAVFSEQVGKCHEHHPLRPAHFSNSFN